MNFIANQSARDANQYTASAATELIGPQGYTSLSQRYDEDRSMAMQLYISTAILSAIAEAYLLWIYFTNQRVKLRFINEHLPLFWRGKFHENSLYLSNI